jgi:hypothetical protein
MTPIFELRIIARAAPSRDPRPARHDQDASPMTWPDPAQPVTRGPLHSGSPAATPSIARLRSPAPPRTDALGRAIVGPPRTLSP